MASLRKMRYPSILFLNRAVPFAQFHSTPLQLNTVSLGKEIAVSGLTNVSVSQCPSATALVNVATEVGDKKIISSHLLENSVDRCKSVRMGRCVGSSF